MRVELRDVDITSVFAKFEYVLLVLFIVGFVCFFVGFLVIRNMKLFDPSFKILSFETQFDADNVFGKNTLIVLLFSDAEL